MSDEPRAEQAFYESVGSPGSYPSWGGLLAMGTAVLLLLVPLAFRAVLDEWTLHVDGGERGPESPVPGY